MLLSAQAGAGKTSLAEALADQFSDHGGAVAIDVDAMKPYHPNWPALVAANGVRAWDLVIPEARHWFERSLDYLAQRRVNVIAEHGLRSPDVIDSLLQRFQTAGYRIEVALLATPRPVSRLGILERYQTGYEWTGLGRSVSGAEHDWRYDNLLKVADLVENDSRVSSVGVYRRGSAQPLYRTGQAPGHACARDALQAERDRPWTLAESESFLRRHDSLRARMADTWQQPLREAREAAEPLLHPGAGRGAARDAGTVG